MLDHRDALIPVLAGRGSLMFVQFKGKNTKVKHNTQNLIGIAFYFLNISLTVNPR